MCAWSWDFAGFIEILPTRTRTDHNVYKRFKPCSAHTNRLGDPVLPIDDEFLRQTAKDLPTGRKLHRTRRFNGTRDIVFCDLPAGPGDCYNTSFVFPTREEVCEYAFDLAEHDGTLVMIHDLSGQIEDQIRFERLPLS